MSKFSILRVMTNTKGWVLKQLFVVTLFRAQLVNRRYLRVKDFLRKKDKGKIKMSKKSSTLEVNEFDIDRLRYISKGKVLPVTERDRLFLNTYKSAFSGELFAFVISKIGERLVKLTVNDLAMIMIGYSMGQTDLEVIDMEKQRVLQKGKLKMH